MTLEKLKELADDCDKEDRLDLTECADALRWAIAEIELSRKPLARYQQVGGV